MAGLIEAVPNISEGRRQEVVDARRNYRRTLLSVAFEAVREQAKQHRTTTTGSEIVGLVPEDALPPEAERSLQLIDFGEHKVLERRARKKTGKKKNSLNSNHHPRSCTGRSRTTSSFDTGGNVRA